MGQLSADHIADLLTNTNALPMQSGTVTGFLDGGMRQTKRPKLPPPPALSEWDQLAYTVPIFLQ